MLLELVAYFIPIVHEILDVISFKANRWLNDKQVLQIQKIMFTIFVFSEPQSPFLDSYPPSHDRGSPCEYPKD